MEREDHFYFAKHTKLPKLGLQPHHLTDETIRHLLQITERYRSRIDLATIPARVRWNPNTAPVEAGSPRG